MCAFLQSSLRPLPHPALFAMTVASSPSSPLSVESLLSLYDSYASRFRWDEAFASSLAWPVTAVALYLISQFVQHTHSL